MEKEIIYNHEKKHLVIKINNKIRAGSRGKIASKFMKAIVLKEDSELQNDISKCLLDDIIVSCDELQLSKGTNTNRKIIANSIICRKIKK